MAQVLKELLTCYLIIQNADPTKAIVALGQTYFAVQTRKQELFDQSNEDEKRILLREEMKTHNKKLADAAKNAGVIEPRDFGIFQNHGYKGLYGGLTVQDIKTKRDLKQSQDILDYMGSTELAAICFGQHKQKRNFAKKTYKANSKQIKRIIK